MCENAWTRNADGIDDDPKVSACRKSSRTYVLWKAITICRTSSPLVAGSSFNVCILPVENFKYGCFWFPTAFKICSCRLASLGMFLLFSESTAFSSRSVAEAVKSGLYSKEAYEYTRKIKRVRVIAIGIGTHQHTHVDPLSLSPPFSLWNAGG